MSAVDDLLALLEKIRTQVHLGAAGVVMAGRLLTELKERLPHGRYEATVRSELDLDPSDARRLREIAAHPVLAKQGNFPRLPGAASTLYQLSLLEAGDLESALADGEVSPVTKCHEATALVHRYGGRGVAPPISKPDLDGNGLHHPAKFSNAVLGVLAEILDAERAGALGPGPKRGADRERYRVLDPFAGVGRIHELVGVETVGVEIEPEWAALAPGTVVGNALDLPDGIEDFDAVATSPCYGNRLADSHAAVDPHLRRSYTHDLGHTLHPDNAGGLQWGDAYRHFHKRAWVEVDRVLRPGGLFLVNLKDHTRAGVRQAVSAWHARLLMDELGCSFVDCIGVNTPHLRQGANAEARWAEVVWVLRKPPARARRAAS